jgi:hypothetical protein
MTKLDTLIEIEKVALGFFLGLLLNSFVEHWKEKNVARRMLSVIAAESRANLAILQEGFLEYFREGLVLSGFSMDAESEYLANPLRGEANVTINCGRFAQLRPQSETG